MALVRHNQIASHIDTTYHEVLVPTVLRLCGENIVRTTVLDVGCGTGHLTRRISEEAKCVVGVDPSKRSIEVARNKVTSAENIDFFLGTIERFSNASTLRFDIAVANMTLMDCLHLDATVQAIAKVLRRGSPLVCTITHPWYWPIYWGYHDQPWFNYREEISIEAPFRITAERTQLLTTHIHRSLERYMSSLAMGGFVIEKLLEPMPPPTTNGPVWSFPRYLAFRAILMHRRAG